ncbi:MAG: glycosyltransferase family 4 protein [Proteobacteria bacterium]|nr:glycosyltransferase family 4 protein [Pseudomonadota bacterium]
MHVVLVLDTAYVNGGQAKVCFDSAFALKARGHDVTVFAAAGPVMPALIEAGIRVHCLDQPELLKDASPIAAAWRGIHNGAAAAALGEVLAEMPRGESVIHVHGWAKALSSAIAGPIRRSGLPALYTMHEYFLLCPNGGFYDYRAHRHCGLSPLSPACLMTQCDSRSMVHKAWRSVRTGVMKHLHHLPDVFGDIAYFHPFQRRIIEKHLPVTARLHEIANPVEAADLGPKTEPTRGEVIFLGRISMEKGVFLFAEAAERAGITPVFVGDGPLAGELAARFPQARLLGWHDAAGVRQRLREARALVFPSLWYEGQPLTVLESLALGTPVIAGDGSAGRESVVDGETGLWFRQGDVADLARALTRIQDDALVARLSAQAYRRYWAEPFTLERHSQRLEAVYSTLLGR